jgi:hypothetical protein
MEGGLAWGRRVRSGSGEVGADSGSRPGADGTPVWCRVRSEECFGHGPPHSYVPSDVARRRSPTSSSPFWPSVDEVFSGAAIFGFRALTVRPVTRMAHNPARATPGGATL